MNYLDVILIVPMIWGAFKGFKKGLVTEVSTLIALMLGIYGGIKLTDYTANLLRVNFEWDTEYLPVVGFAVAFILIIIIVFLLGKAIEKLVDVVALGIVNKVSGAAFGLAKFTLIMSVVLMVVNSIDQRLKVFPKKIKEGSLLYQPMSDLSLTIIPAIQDSEVYKDASTVAAEKKEELDEELDND